MFSAKMKVLFVLMIFIILAIADDLNESKGTSDDDSNSSGADLARKKKSRFPFHLLGYGYGIHALAILYWLKVKAIIISFIVGTSIVWGFRYFAHYFKSCPEVIHEGPIIPYDHGSYHGHDHIEYSPGHDHIGYSSGHDHIGYSSSPDVLDHDPYGGYPYPSSSEVVESDSPPHRRRTTKGRMISEEEKVSDIIFTFLGVGSDACRRRFICEMEFRSNDHPLTRMAFRMIGHGIFFRYIRNETAEAVPRSFAECAQVHGDCQFIEENISEDETNKLDVADEAMPDVAAQVPEFSVPTKKSKKKVDKVVEAIMKRPSN